MMGIECLHGDTEAPAPWRQHCDQYGALRPFWVINAGGYIGSSTRSEIAYAITTGIRIERLR